MGCDGVKECVMSHPLVPQVPEGGESVGDRVKLPGGWGLLQVPANSPAGTQSTIDNTLYMYSTLCGGTCKVAHPQSVFVWTDRTSILYTTPHNTTGSRIAN